MLADKNCGIEEAKRPRKPSFEVEDSSHVPRKRQTKNCTEDLNPYESIPEIPHVKLSDEDM